MPILLIIVFFILCGMFGHWVGGLAGHPWAGVLVSLIVGAILLAKVGTELIYTLAAKAMKDGGKKQ